MYKAALDSGLWDNATRVARLLEVFVGHLGTRELTESQLAALAACRSHLVDAADLLEHISQSMRVRE